MMEILLFFNDKLIDDAEGKLKTPEGMAVIELCVK